MVGVPAQASCIFCAQLCQIAKENIQESSCRACEKARVQGPNAKLAAALAHTYASLTLFWHACVRSSQPLRARTLSHLPQARPPS